MLQRATGGLSAAGNWIMQMAVFRAASWTVAQGTSSTRFHGVVDASQFPGGIGAAIASLPACSPYSQCGTVYVPQGTYTFTSTLTVPIGVTLKLDRNAILQCDVRDSMQKTICVQMQNASTLDCGGGTGSNSYGVAGAAIVGLSTTSARAGGPDLRR